MLTLVNISGLLLAIAIPVAIFLLPRPQSALARAAIGIVLAWVAAVLYAGLVVNPAGIEAGHAAGEHFPEARYDNNTIASALLSGWLVPLLSVGVVAVIRRVLFRKAASLDERTPNKSLERTREG